MNDETSIFDSLNVEIAHASALAEFQKNNNRVYKTAPLTISFLINGTI